MFTQEKVIAITLARGGSKRLPGKNIRLLNGKPMVAYTIEATIQAVGHCYVSTDDDAIADTAIRYGANVLRRPESLAQDNTNAAEVLFHVFMQQIRQDGIVVFLNATSPLRNAEDITGALQHYRKGQYDSLLSACEYNKFLWANACGVTIKPINYDPKKRPRSQDMTKSYQENGAIYISTTDFIRTHRGQWLGGKIGIYVMPELRSFEIDTQEDFWLCERIIELTNIHNFA